MRKLKPSMLLRFLTPFGPTTASAWLRGRTQITRSTGKPKPVAAGGKNCSSLATTTIGPAIDKRVAVASTDDSPTDSDDVRSLLQTNRRAAITNANEAAADALLWLITSVTPTAGNPPRGNIASNDDTPLENTG